MNTSIRRLVLGIVTGLFVSLAAAAEPAWVNVTNPTAAEVAGKFKEPPNDYANTVTWGWNGPMTEDVIVRDLDTLHERGLRMATIEAGYRMDNAPYLSDEWFKLIRFTAEQAQRRGMKLLVIDEGKYPSGFVNGKYTRERPELRMQALVGAGREQITGGQVFEKAVEPNVISAIAYNAETSIPLTIAEGRIRWDAPAGQWTISMVAHDFRTPQTRAVIDPTQAKTTANAMGDLIHPEASRLFIEWTHEQYKKHVGDLFGKVIVGFRGDEPEMTGIPWTPAIKEEFLKRKGYDVTPYMASFVTGGGGGRGGPQVAAMPVSEAMRRAKADYFDVWGELFGHYFFDAQAEWCAANGLVAATHLNNDHNLPGLVATTADFFRPMRNYQAAGVDVIWSQVYPGKVAEFVRFPSSAAHLNGRSRALSESFAAYNADEPATYEVVKFAVNYQLARGINWFEFMFFMSSSGGPRPEVRGYMGDAKFPALAAYANRMTYVLSQGKPMAQIALYCPTMSMWMNDRTSNESLMFIAQHLSDNQRDFDVVDDYSLASGMKLDGGQFTNKSGQAYRAVIVPASTAISQAALDRLQSFAKAGGKVIFIGYKPTLAVGKNFLEAKAPADLSWAMHEPSGEVSPAVLNALPKSDVVFEMPNPAIKVMHRKWQDSDVYFFFNESDQAQSITATVEAKGQAQIWDGYGATIQQFPGTRQGADRVRLPLQLEGQSAKLIVIGPGVELVSR